MNTPRLLMLAGLVSALPIASVTAATLPAVEAPHAMVVSAQALAAQAGHDILAQGGNAIDAAVAVGFAEAVVNPCCGNIGGGGFMTLHLASGQDLFLDFRETAPAAASADMYLTAEGNVRKGESLYGYRAVGVPGTVSGLLKAHEHYGKLSRQQVMAPAIALARDGFILTRADTDIMDSKVELFRKDPETARIFLRPDGSAWQPNDRFVQKDLARTLSDIAHQGAAAFYTGRIPAAVEAASNAHAGLLKASDFAHYDAKFRTPVSCDYRGYRVISAPPPSSGGVTLCETLNILEGYDLGKSGFNSAETVHLMTEALRRAYADRNTYLGDPDVINNPIAQMTDKKYAASLRASIEAQRATPSSSIKPPADMPERPETTHYSVMDSAGNAVSTTFTINGRFGSGVIAPGTGFLLNDEMDDFTVKVGEQNSYGLVQGTRNAIAPNKRPLSSMAPTIVTKEGQVYLVVGSPGGSRIITTVLQVISNVVDHHMGLQEAVDAPRIHHQWYPDVIYYEQNGLSADTQTVLKQQGYTLVEQTPWSGVEAIMKGVPGVLDHAAESSGNDGVLSGKVRAGYVYGSNDARRPAGAAKGL